MLVIPEGKCKPEGQVTQPDPGEVWANPKARVWLMPSLQGLFILASRENGNILKDLRLAHYLPFLACAGETFLSTQEPQF